MWMFDWANVKDITFGVRYTHLPDRRPCVDLVKIVLNVIVRQDGVVCIELDIIGKEFNCCVMMEVVSYVIIIIIIK